MHSLIPVFALLARVGWAIQYDDASVSSIDSAASTIAAGMMSYYTGNQPGGVPGLFPYPPYFWWESGSAFGHLVDYYYYTGDAQYNDETIAATTWQAGMNGEFFPSNQSFDMGNDDESFWAFTAMNAAESKFPAPPSSYPSWSTMVDVVFNVLISRWDSTTCGGGLRWQVFSTSTGYTYKNIAANGAFFMIAARLARYSGNNETYVQWAEKQWEWMQGTALIDSTTNPDSWIVYDGIGTGDCNTPSKTQWSYNYGLLFGGLAYIYNHTGDPKWLTPLYGIMNGTLDAFFREDKVIVEYSCELNNFCQSNPDWTTFKSFTIRWMAVTTQLVPQLADTLWPYLLASANGAAGQCDGEPDGTACGYHWTTTTWDGTTGLGQEMSALAAVGAPMILAKNLPPPLTLDTGATSKVNPNVSSSAGVLDGAKQTWANRPITTGDKAGAGIVTFVLIVAMLGLGWWLTIHST